jgi:hypothetical protein
MREDAEIVRAEAVRVEGIGKGSEKHKPGGREGERWDE